ncbi:unnamed protein product [Caenorhabditis bovis]|uniref:CID domain-containing protein n=1 Tax=Caenorhabditis bovis TaxID=2654633 RepID=A0A8S1EU63_9PELO|nr:unnamed protein product [Caenorhabditis bovis]
MVMLTSDVVMKRLQDIHAPTQEAIETMSLWIMHYKDKASIDVIVEGWLNAFRIASNDQKRIALFYVMNDVVQKAKNKHIDTLIPAFQPAVLTAVGIGRKFTKVKDVMKRCIEIFAQRHVFTSASITAMQNLINADDAYDAEETALDIDNDEIVRKVTAFITARNVVSDMMKYVNDGDFNYKERIRTGMKDREEGAHVLQEVHDAIDTMVKVRHAMEGQKQKMVELIETLELAKRVFMHQKREVLVVEEAYINFRDGIKAVHKDLLEMEATGIYPGITPPRNAPSPTAEDDIYATGVENAIQPPQTWDNRQAVDMEMDEEDRPQESMPKLVLPPPPTAPQPSLHSRIMQLGLKKIAEGDQDDGQTLAGVEAPTQPDFTKPPPAFNMSVPPPPMAGLNAFGVPLKTPLPTVSRSIQDILKSIPSAAALSAQTADATRSSYQMALQQHGIASTSDRDERLAPPSAYHATFEPRDPVEPAEPRFPGLVDPQLIEPPKLSDPDHRRDFPRFSRDDRWSRGGGYADNRNFDRGDGYRPRGAAHDRPWRGGDRGGRGHNWRGGGRGYSRY